MAVITLQERLLSQNCCTCGILFAIPEAYDKQRQEDHKSFFCPAGHSQCYIGKTEAEKLRDQLAAKEREIAAAKKIVAGRCPCCSHKFKDLAIHMRSEHPNYDPEKAVAAIEAKA